jgi:hypothetical protein
MTPPTGTPSLCTSERALTTFEVEEEHESACIVKTMPGWKRLFSRAKVCYSLTSIDLVPCSNSMCIQYLCRKDTRLNMCATFFRFDRPVFRLISIYISKINGYEHSQCTVGRSGAHAIKNSPSCVTILNVLNIWASASHLYPPHVLSSNQSLVNT